MDSVVLICVEILCLENVAAEYNKRTDIYQFSEFRYGNRRHQEKTPKYLQIYEQVQRGILNGELKPGDRLPSFSQLRAQYGAMPATAERAYLRLERENLVVRQAQRGVFVAPRELSRTGNIGLLLRSAYLTPSYDSPYMEILLAGIRESCHKQKLKVVLIEDAGELEFEHVDGILLYSDKLEAYSMSIAVEMAQVILLQHANEITAVMADDFGGSKLATSHLIERGHRRIACLMEELRDIPMQRRAGYQAALREAGITMHSDWLRVTEKMRSAETASYLEWGRRNMRA